MQKAQKAAAETKAQRNGSFRLKHQRSIVELQFFQRVAQIVVIGIFYRIEAAVNHRRGLAVTGQSFIRGIAGVGNGIANARILNVFNGGCQKAYLPGIKLINNYRVRLKHADFRYFKFSSGCHHAYFHAFSYAAVYYAEIKHNTFISIKFGIKHQCF